MVTNALNSIAADNSKDSKDSSSDSSKKRNQRSLHFVLGKLYFHVINSSRIFQLYLKKGKKIPTIEQIIAHLIEASKLITENQVQELQKAEKASENEEQDKEEDDEDEEVEDLDLEDQKDLEGISEVLVEQFYNKTDTSKISKKDNSKNNKTKNEVNNINDVTADEKLALKVAFQTMVSLEKEPSLDFFAEALFLNGLAHAQKYHYEHKNDENNNKEKKDEKKQQHEQQNHPWMSTSSPSFVSAFKNENLKAAVQCFNHALMFANDNLNITLQLGRVASLESFAVPEALNTLRRVSVLSKSVLRQETNQNKKFFAFGPSSSHPSASAFVPSHSSNSYFNASNVASRPSSLYFNLPLSRIHYDFGNISLEQSQYHQAISYYQKALEPLTSCTQQLALSPQQLQQQQQQSQQSQQQSQLIKHFDFLSFDAQLLVFKIYHNLAITYECLSSENQSNQQQQGDSQDNESYENLSKLYRNYTDTITEINSNILNYVLSTTQPEDMYQPSTLQHIELQPQQQEQQQQLQQQQQQQQEKPKEAMTKDEQDKETVNKILSNLKFVKVIQSRAEEIQHLQGEGQLQSFFKEVNQAFNADIREGRIRDMTEEEMKYVLDQPMGASHSDMEKLPEDQHNNKDSKKKEQDGKKKKKDKEEVDLEEMDKILKQLSNLKEEEFEAHLNRGEAEEEKQIKQHLKKKSAKSKDTHSNKATTRSTKRTRFDE